MNVKSPETRQKI